MDVIQVIITAVAVLPIGIFVGVLLATKHWLIDRPNETAAYLGYRWLKSAWDNPPPEEYVPDGIEAELYMDDNPDKYPDFQMSWDG